MNKLQKAQKKFNEEGASGLFRYILKYIGLKVPVFFWVIYTSLRLKTLRRNLSPKELFHFASTVGNEIIIPLQIESEITSLMDFVKKIAPKTFVEIGTASGGTLFLISRSIPDDAKIISIDLPHGMYGGGYPKWKIPVFKSFVKGKQKMKLLRGDSHSKELLEELKKELAGNEIDLLFIDGDHSYEGVKMDFEMYSPLVKNGGYIIFHDVVVHSPEKQTDVNKLWLELRMRYEYQEFVESWDQGRAGIGVIKYCK